MFSAVIKSLMVVSVKPAVNTLAFCTQCDVCICIYCVYVRGRLFAIAEHQMGSDGCEWTTRHVFIKRLIAIQHLSGCHSDARHGKRSLEQTTLFPAKMSQVTQVCHSTWKL